jgi:hypothetical protein
VCKGSSKQQRQAEEHDVIEQLQAVHAQLHCIHVDCLNNIPGEQSSATICTRLAMSHHLFRAVNMHTRTDWVAALTFGVCRCNGTRIVQIKGDIWLSGMAADASG